MARAKSTTITTLSVAEARAKLRELGVEVGNRGRLSQAHRDALAAAGFAVAE